MTWVTRLLAGLAIASVAAPAAAQVAADGEKFVNMLRDGDNDEALALLHSKPIIIDAIDGRGETALLVAIKDRNVAWTSHLLRQGANPNLAGRNGDTPLIAAARAGFTEAAGWLLSVGAKIDSANRRGETALIVAVQEHRAPIVRMLVAAGANPDRTDAVAGFSARDYAKRENRFPELLAAIEAGKSEGKPQAKPKPADSLDDFKLN